MFGARRFQLDIPDGDETKGRKIRGEQLCLAPLNFAGKNYTK